MKINVKNIVLQRIDSESRDEEIYQDVVKVLKPYEGKKLTKRELTKIASALAKYGYKKISILPDLFCVKLLLTDPKHPDKFRREYGLGLILFYDYERAGGFSLEAFAEHNEWASRGASERVKKSLEALQNGTVEKLQEAYDLLAQAQKILGDVSKYNVPFLYDLEEQFGFSLRKL
jgi:hypothetical protein